MPANRSVLVRAPRRTRPWRAISPVAVTWITRPPRTSLHMGSCRKIWGRIRPPRPPKDSWGGLPLDGAMEAVAQEIAERLRPAPFVRIVTHIDTDGITGGAIASEALDRAGISHEIAFVKKLDEAVITDLKRQGTPLVWFIDL